LDSASNSVDARLPQEVLDAVFAGPSAAAEAPANANGGQNFQPGNRSAALATSDILGSESNHVSTPVAEHHGSLAAPSGHALDCTRLCEPWNFWPCSPV
jgi:hypothetical protein